MEIGNLLYPKCKCNAPRDGYKAMLLPSAITPTQLDLYPVMFLPICLRLDEQPNHQLRNSPAMFIIDYFQKRKTVKKIENREDVSRKTL